MSLRVGLGASQEDIDVQGEIDFDFFDESDHPSNSKEISVSKDPSSEISVKNDILSNTACSPAQSLLSKSKYISQSDLDSTNAGLSNSSCDLRKPRITVSCEQATGMIQKTTIETVIPSPYNYKDKCEKGNLSDLRKGNIVQSPRLRTKIYRDDHDISDDSSISSMSDSEGSTLSTESEDSFEMNDSDSMTDVSPLPSPLCFTPSKLEQNGSPSAAVPSSSASKEPRKEGVKFLDEIGKKQCPKCESFNFQELVTAMNHLKMTQNLCARKCKSPVLTQNAKSRKNLSFSNEEVRKIDRDNQLLLNKITAQQNRPKTPATSGSHVRASAAVTRQRQQRQIELENLALLKRLESTKPSKNLSRNHLLKDYDQRSAAVLSRASSRSSYPSGSQSSFRTSSHSSGRSSAISIKSSNSSTHSKLSVSYSSVPDKI